WCTSFGRSKAVTRYWATRTPTSVLELSNGHCHSESRTLRQGGVIQFVLVIFGRERDISSLRMRSGPTQCLLSVFALLAVIGSSITAFEYCARSKFSKECECGSNARGKPINSADAENASQGNNDDVSLLGTEEKIVLPVCLEKCKPFFNCFCIFTNGEKILNTASSEGQLPSLHGIRFLSMTWVILCHTYASVASIV
ncbi:hypothetical protein AVEN_43054-1, partial [Araneus ventricosus]